MFFELRVLFNLRSFSRRIVYINDNDNNNNKADIDRISGLFFLEDCNLNFQFFYIIMLSIILDGFSGSQQGQPACRMPGACSLSNNLDMLLLCAEFNA
jgi:hypothetical protein